MGPVEFTEASRIDGAAISGLGAGRGKEPVTIAASAAEPSSLDPATSGGALTIATSATVTPLSSAEAICGVSIGVAITSGARMRPECALANTAAPSLAPALLVADSLMCPAATKPARTIVPHKPAKAAVCRELIISSLPASSNLTALPTKPENVRPHQIHTRGFGEKPNRARTKTTGVLFSVMCCLKATHTMNNG